MRLEFYIVEKAMKKGDFAKEIGVTRSVLDKIIGGRNVHWSSIQAVVHYTKGVVSYEDLESKKNAEYAKKKNEKKQKENENPSKFRRIIKT